MGAVIVDLSEAKPNVLYEAGYAHALNKPCIHTAQPRQKNSVSMSAIGRRPCIIRARRITGQELAQKLKAVLD